MKKEWEEQIREAVLKNANFAEMSDEELDAWIAQEIGRLLISFTFQNLRLCKCLAEKGMKC